MDYCKPAHRSYYEENEYKQTENVVNMECLGIIKAQEDLDKFPWQMDTQEDTEKLEIINNLSSGEMKIVVIIGKGGSP